MNDPETTRAVLDWSAVFMRLYLDDFLRFTRGSGLSWMQLALLMHLHYRGPLELMACGELLQLSPSGASQMIERLVQQGLVERNETPEDRRVRLVRLTAEGQKVVDQGIQAQHAWLAPLLAELTDEQRSSVGEALRLLTAQATRLGEP
jgi:DNA-binding MarR family transcriptional regulator